MSDEPAPISMSRKKAPAKTKPVESINKPAPEHSEPKLVVVKKEIVKPIVADKALEARVARLEEERIVTPIVAPKPRPRITRVAVEYDNFGTPKALVPTYE